ncbi:MAG: S8 family serine peptidase, partial [Oscillospiraceae bacterium]|nr:S8 family serine peptidase [Oscillospiraceae bacterium]
MRQIRTLTAALLALVLTLGLWPAASGAAAGGPEIIPAAPGESAAEVPAEAPAERAERYVLKLRAGAVWPEDLFDGPDGAPSPIPYTDDLYVADTWAQVIALVRAGLVEIFAKDEPLRLLEGIETGAGQYRQAVGVDALWNAGYDGTGVTVAVVDSGVYAGHEDLDAGRFDGANFIGWTGASPAKNYDADETGHGTFVSGVISAVRGNGVGVDGLAGGARLLIARCFPEEDVQTSEVLAAIGYAVEQDADVINMSFGGAGASVAALMRAPLEKARRKGIILVAAAGNDGAGGEVQYPAGSDGVIGVGMVDTQGYVAGQSTRNHTVDVTAPGFKMIGLGHEAPDHYISGSGTSYAAPVVTALAAMARQADPGLDGEDFLALLKESAEDKGAPGYDESYGWGVVGGARLLAALERARAIRYETDGGRIEGTAGVDYSAAYTVARSADARLPASATRAGSLFVGWYDNPDGAGAPLTAVPPGTVGDVTYYARWIDVSDVAVARLRVDGVSAERTGETAFHVALPAGTDLAGLTAQQIEIEPVNAQAVFSVPETADGGVTWTFSGSLGGGRADYTLTVGLSDAPRPEAGPDVTGAAAPASLDEKTPASPFRCELTGAFRGVTGDTVYAVTASDGAGTARIDGTELIYTPAPPEAGRTVTLSVRAQTGAFAARSELRVTVAVGALPVSDAVLSPAEGVYDKAAPGDAGVTVLVTHYGNRLTAVERAGAALVSGADYRAETEAGAIQPVTLTDAFLRGLP